MSGDTIFAFFGAAEGALLIAPAMAGERWLALCRVSLSV
jgi:hypothetical protein